MHRKTSSGERNYYICSTYNSKGKRYCPKAHLIEEEALITDVLTFLHHCRETLTKDPIKLTSYGNGGSLSIEKARQALNDQKKQLQLLLRSENKRPFPRPRKRSPDSGSLLYSQKERSEKILALEKELQETETSLSTKPLPFNDPLTLLDQLIENRSLTRKDLALLIDRIEVSETGDANFYLHGALAARRHAGDGV
ncbi:MAG: zinc ribbon domain-containing protein [Lachnospiraceae bacterium]